MKLEAAGFGSRKSHYNRGITVRYFFSPASAKRQGVASHLLCDTMEQLVTSYLHVCLSYRYGRGTVRRLLWLRKPKVPLDSLLK